MLVQPSSARSLLLTAGALVTLQQGAHVNALSCPSAGAPPVPVTDASPSFDLSSADQVCLLQRVTTDATDGTKTFASAGRSYNGREWESVAGPYTTEIQFDCTGASCTTTEALPALEGNQEFVLVAAEHTVTDEEEVARFLEQATFGPTRALLNNWTSGQSFDDWVKDAIDSDVVTEHRQYFRARANARATLLKDTETAVIDRPCDASSRWRQYAFGWEEDKYDQQITVTVADADTFLVSVDGVPRTEVPKSIWVDQQVPETGGGPYELCGHPGEFVGGRLRLRVNGSCKYLYNPEIAFSVTTPPNVVSQSVDLTLLDIDGNEGTLVSAISGNSVCEGLPAEGGVSAFAKAASNGKWYMHDPRIVLQDNTLDSVLADGGDAAVTASGGMTQCANAPRTFLNKDQCVLAPSGCSEDLENGTNVVVCGSPGEISNDQSKMSQYDMAQDSSEDNSSLFERQKQNIWMAIALESPDQLRQRMAWALSQILTMVPMDIDAEDETEAFLVFYDILVRHAFGNYRDILKEVSFSPMMAEMLTYRQSKSMAYVQDRDNVQDVFPDENFAREVMQLFSVGLNKLNMDGTLVVDENGENPLTYDNDDIMDGARAWTGFDRQLSRGNVEDMRHRYNRIDPLQMVPTWRDPYPKMGLDGTYIGDGLPLCVDAPDDEFLKIGAAYRFLGSSSLPELQSDNDDWQGQANIVRVVIKSGSALYQELCNPGGDGSCDLTQMEVTLTSNLECDASEGSLECTIDQPRVVELEGQNLFFEYMKPPCVQFPFFDNALKLKTKNRGSDALCGDPLLSIATETCCALGKEYHWRGERACAYTGERVTFQTNEHRCDTAGKQACSWQQQSYLKSDGVTIRGNCGENTCCSYRDNFFWSTAPCSITAKISPDDGKIALVHNHTDWDNYNSEYLGEIKDSLQPSNINYFRVKWESEDVYPTDAATCGGDCSWIADENACFCPFTLTESAVFSASPPSYADALAQLHIGSAHPDAKGCTAGATSSPDSDGNAVKTWECSGNAGIDAETVFELIKSGSGVSKFLKNSKSIVSLNSGGTAPLSFRNSPHFVGFVEQDARDMEREVDAVLDQYFYHSNTAPFVASRLIQRFGISNPSPRYVEAVSTAFATGSYQSSPSAATIGSGDYGCLASTLAAILLDPEARSPVLEKDPSYGGLREPILKLVHLMRAMEFEPSAEETFEMRYVSDRIGQMAHAVPTVFSFFLPDFIPPGRATAASLASPEAETTNTPTVLGLLEGMFSLIKYGLSECYGGFGGDTEGSCSQYDESETLESHKALGRLTYEPTEGVDMFEEVSLLLTSGRLSRDPVVMHFLYELGLGTEDDAGMLRVVQQLVAASPEFHSNALVKRTVARPAKAPLETSTKPYKAIVYFFMAGGMDSYNLIVPDESSPECEAMSTMYKDTRGEIALELNELGGPVSAASQPACKSFRFHKELSFVEQLYKDGDAAVLANTGVLFSPVTLDNWKEQHADTNLFAHDVQQREAKHVDPFDAHFGTGVLGRMTDELKALADPFQTGQLSLENRGEAVAGSGEGFTNFVSSNEVTPFDPEKSVPRLHRAGIAQINNMTEYDSNVFGELWSSRVVQAMGENQEFYEAMQNIELEGNDFDSATGGSAANELEMIAKLIKGHDSRKTDRDVCYLSRGGWDTHDELKPRMVENFKKVNSALEDFVAELKAQEVWNDVVVVVASEFSRTLSGNSGDGTDHGWAGNYLIIGGDVKGNQMHGTYPTDYEAISVGRSRLHPTMPWEGIWKGTAEWFGVPTDKVNNVLPNLDAFSDSGVILSASDLFDSGSGGGATAATRRKNIRA